MKKRDYKKTYDLWTYNFGYLENIGLHVTWFSSSDCFGTSEEFIYFLKTWYIKIRIWHNQILIFLI